MAAEQFSLCWDNFHKNMSSGMHSLLESEDLVDVTLAIEGQHLKAHKMVLSVCSPYFRSLFSSNPCKHPIVFMKDVSYLVMNDLLTFMYQGEVQVNQEHLATFIKTAEALQIKGLTGDNNESEEVVESETKTSIKRPLVDETKKLIKRTTGSAPKKAKTVTVPIASPPPSPVLVAKLEEPHPTTQEIVQFKMEPFEAAADSNQSDAQYDNQADSYVDESIEETADEYSMMEEEEEPKPGPSAVDGASGDCQGLSNPHVVLKREATTRKSKTRRNKCRSCASRGQRTDSIYECQGCPDKAGYYLNCCVIYHQ